MVIELGKCIVERRRGKGLYQKDLALRAGMSAGQLCLIESGRVSPTFNMVERIARALDTDIQGLLSSESGRDGAEKTSSERAEALPSSDYVPVRAIEPDAARALRLVLDMERERDELAASRGVPFACSLALNRAGLRFEGAGAALAEELRTELGLGTAPIVDLETALEFRGVRLRAVKLSKHTTSVAYWDAKATRPLIVLNSLMTDERRRYRTAYELASACLYVSLGCQRLDESLPQHRFLTDFTAAFLMPAVTVRLAVASTGLGPDDWTFDELVALKSRFGVSAESFVLRLEELGLITPYLRLDLRDRLRAYYRKHPKSMEPQPKGRSCRAARREQVKGVAE